jgi:ribosomal protein S18 acetylase RimI-like enzyme
MQKPTPSAPGAATHAPLRIALAADADLPEVLRVQRAAFGRVARLFGIPPEAMAPIAETLEQIVRLRERGVRTLVALEGDRIVGTVRTSLREDGVAEVGRLAVDDGFERRGIARTLMLAVEEDRPTAIRFELFTGADAVGPIALYESLGYRVFSREQFERWAMVWLAKDRSAPTVGTDTPLHWQA